MQKIEENSFFPQSNAGPHQTFLSSLVVAVSDVFRRVVQRLNATLPKDGTEEMTAPLRMAEYTVATRPTASDWPGGVIFVSDGGAGAEIQGSNGTSWVNLG